MGKSCCVRSLRRSEAPAQYQVCFLHRPRCSLPQRHAVRVGWQLAAGCKCNRGMYRTTRRMHNVHHPPRYWTGWQLVRGPCLCFRPSLPAVPAHPAHPAHLANRCWQQQACSRGHGGRASQLTPNPFINHHTVLTVCVCRGGMLSALTTLPHHIWAVVRQRRRSASWCVAQHARIGRALAHHPQC